MQTAESTAAIDAVFTALSDASRRSILDRLSRSPASISQVAAPMDMSLAAVVQHINVLEKSGLVRTEKIGRTRTCSIDPKGFSMAEQWISHRRNQWEKRFDRLAGFLDEEEDGEV